MYYLCFYSIIYVSGNFPESFRKFSSLLGLPGVRFSTGQSGFLAICPVEKMGLNRTMSCPVIRPLLKLLMTSAVDRNLAFTHS
jgi:hypothetical protein